MPPLFRRVDTQYEVVSYGNAGGAGTPDYWLNSAVRGWGSPCGDRVGRSFDDAQKEVMRRPFVLTQVFVAPSEEWNPQQLKTQVT